MVRSSLKLLAFICLLLAGSVPSALAAVTTREETIVATVPYKGSPADAGEKQVRISGVLWVPQDGRAKHPLAIYSHGSQTAAGDGNYAVNAKQFGAFLERGYAVFYPLRKGFNRSGTPKSQASAALTEPFSCSGAEDGVQSAVSDSKALIAALRESRQPDVDLGNITLVGHSRGGLLAVALAAEGLRGVKKVLNFSGGWQTDCLEFNTMKFASFAQRIKVPIFSFYGAHDSAWNANHMKANLAALEAKGIGKGHILPGAGHNLFDTHVEQWAPVVFGK